MKSRLWSMARGSSRIGLLSDIAMVAAAARRVATKPTGGAGAGVASSARSALPPGEMLLVAGAAFRLLRRIRTVRRRRRGRDTLTIVED